MKHSCFFYLCSACTVHSAHCNSDKFHMASHFYCCHFLCFKWQNVSFKWFYFLLLCFLLFFAFFQPLPLNMHNVDAWFYFIISILFSPIHSWLCCTSSTETCVHDSCFIIKYVGFFSLAYEFARDWTTFRPEPIRTKKKYRRKRVQQECCGFKFSSCFVNNSLSIWSEPLKNGFHKFYGEKSSMFNENNWTQEC